MLVCKMSAFVSIIGKNNICLTLPSEVSQFIYVYVEFKNDFVYLTQIITIINIYELLKKVTHLLIYYILVFFFFQEQL